MRIVLHIAICLVTFTGFSQEWRDSLDVAREAYKNQEYTKAYKYYKSAQDKAPENIDLSDELAQSAYKSRDFEKAEKIYQQSGSAKNSKQRKADNYHNMGNARMKQRDYAGAVESYKESLRLNPNDDETRYNLSEAIRQLKNQQQNQQNQNEQNQQNQNQNQQNQQNQNQDQQNQNGEDSNNNKSGNEQNSNDKNQPKNSGNSQNKENPSSLPNKTVDRMLDKLMKDEAETKRRLSSNSNKNSSAKSGKDW